MRFSEQLLLIFGMGMDGFAVSLCIGARRISGGQKAAAWLMLTGFHGLLFALGCGVGQGGRILPLLGAVLLVVLGLRQIRESRGKEKDKPPEGLASLALLSLSASVDAATAGLSFALLSPEVKLTAYALAAGVTGLLSAAGLLLGKRIGNGLGPAAERFGGAVLTVLGIKNLLSLL